MAFGVKVKLDVEVVGGAQLRSQIQTAIENATQGKPVKLRHLSVDLGKQEAARISKQLESAMASQDITIRIGKIDASKPVADLKKQLTTMLSGLSITGLKDFLGADGVADSYEKAAKAADKQAEALANVRKRAEETNAALKMLKAAQTQLNSSYKKTSNIEDTEKINEYLDAYHILTTRIEAARNLQGEAQSAEVAGILKSIAALNQQIAATIELEKATKKQAAAEQKAAISAEDAAAAQAREATQSANLAKQTIVLRKQITTWITKNTKAYEANKSAIDSLLSQIADERAVTKRTLAEVAEGFRKIDENASAAGLTGKTFFEMLKAGWAKFGGWTLVTKTMMAAVNAIKKMISAVMDLDAAMTELKKVTDLTEAQYAKFVVSATKTAKKIGASVADTINATADFARLGYDLEEAAALAEAALVYKNVGDGIDDINMATESLISTIKAFGGEAAEAMYIVDMFNEVGNNFAISSTGLGEALQRSASALAAAGNTIQESIGIITAMNAVVQNPEAVGTAAKTLTMYLRAAKTEAEEAGIETDGMAESVSELREEIKSLTGVDIMIDDETFKSTYQIIKEIAAVWDELNDITRSSVLNLLGGKRNANVLSSLITNFEDAEKAMKSATNAMGSAAAENQKHMDSIAGRLTVLKATFEDLALTIVDSSLIKGIVSLGTILLEVVNGVIKAAEVFGGLRTILLTVATGFVAVKGGAAIVSSALSIVGHITPWLSKIGSGLVSIIRIIPNAVAAWQAYAAGTMTASAAIQASIPVIGLILTAISAVAAGISYFSSKTEEAELSIDELKSEFSSLSNTIQTTASDFRSLRDSAQDTIPRFAELAKGVNELGEQAGLTDQEYEEFLRLNNKIAEMFPELSFGMDSNGNAMLALSYTADTLAESLWDVVDAERAAANAMIAGTMPDVLENIHQQGQANIQLLEDLDRDMIYAMRTVAINGGYASANDFEDYEYDSQRYASILKKYGIEYVNEAGKIVVEDAEEVYSLLQTVWDMQANSIINGYEATWKEINMVANAWAQTNPFYDALSEPMQDIVQYMIAGVNFYDLGISTAEGIQNFVQGSIIAPLYNAGPEVREAFAQITDWQQMLKDGEITDAEFAANIEDAFSSLFATMSPEAIESFQSYFVAGMNAMGITGIDFTSVLTNLISEWARLGTVADDSGTSIKSFSDALTSLSKGYDILAKAQEEMAKDGGLSIDTIQSIAGILDEDESIADYLTIQNGAIQLNIDEWKRRSEEIIRANKEAKEAEVAALEAENANLSVLPEDAWVNSDTIAANTERIQELNQEIALYDAILTDIANQDEDALTITATIEGITDIGGEVKNLLSALEQLDKGTALSVGDVAQLALEYEELFGMAPEFDLTTLDGQREALEAILSLYEQELDALIDLQIAELERAKQREDITQDEIDEIDAQINRWTQFKDLTISDIWGDGDTIAGQTKRFSDFADAISEVADAANLLQDIKSGDGDYLSTLQSILDFLGEHPIFNISDFINSDGSFVEVDDALQDKVFESFLADMADLEGYDPSWDDTIRAAWDKIIAGEEEALTATEKISNALGVLDKMQDFEIAQQTGDSGLVEQLTQAMEIAEALNEMMPDGSEAVDWTSWIDSFDAGTGKIEWNTDVMRELINAQIDAAFEGTRLAETQPEIIEALKEAAIAAEETANAYDALSSALSAAGSASSLLTDIRTGSTDVLDMIDQAAKMAEGSGLSLDRFVSIGPNGVAWKEDWQTDYIDSYINKLTEANSDVKKFTDAEISAIRELAVAQMEAAASSEILSTAISGIGTASSLLTDMQSGEGNILDMLSTISDMAAQSGQEMTDFYSFVDGSYVWNTQAVVDWAYVLIDRLASVNGMTEQETNALKSMVAAEIEAAKTAEKISDAYAGAKSATQGLAATDGRTEIDYDTYQKMVETDARYASVIEYQNGVLTVNAERYQEVTNAIIDETKALAEQAMAASAAERSELEMISRSRDLTDAEQARLDTLNAEINGYRVLISELDNASNAYNRYANATASGDTGRYSTLQDMLQTIKDVTQNKDSDIYGMIGDERFKIAYELLISPDIEIDSPEFEKRLKAAERYITDGKKGMDNFVADLTANGFVSEDGVIDASLQEIADALNIDVDFLRGLFDQLNLYLDEPIQIESPDYELSGIEAAIQKADEYLNTGAQGVVKFYQDLADAGLYDEATRRITGTNQEIAAALGISTTAAEECTNRVKESMDGITQVGDEIVSQMTFDEAVEKLQKLTGEIAKLEAASISFEYDEENLTKATETLESLSTTAESLKDINITFKNPEEEESVKLVKSMFADIVAQAEKLSKVTVSLQTTGEDGTGLSDEIAAVSSSLEELNTLQLTLDVNGALESLQSVVGAGELIINMIQRVGENAMTINVKRALASLQSVVNQVQAVINRINAIPSSKTTTVYVRQVRTGFNFGGLSLARGNANAETSFEIPGGKTLTGEQGREIVVDPNTNQWYTVGDHGAEFANLPKGAIVFNARQTKELLETGRTDSRGLSMASGNAAASLWDTLKKAGNAIKNSTVGKAVTSAVSKATSAVKKSPVGQAVSKVAGAVSKVVDTVKGVVSNVVNTAKDKVTGNISSYQTGSSSSSSGGRGTSGSSSSSSQASKLEKLKEQYEELNKQTEHLIAHQEFLYRQAEKGLDYSGMDKSLQAQVELYKKIMADSQAGVTAMIAAGADDTSEELQAMEEAYWSAYDSLYETLDEINTLYVSALNEKIDGIQSAFDNLKTAAEEFNEYGGITVDSFQALLENGVQYMSLLENENGQYVINTEGIQKMIAAQKEQLAVESAISYLKQLQTALADGEANAVANLVNLTNQLSSSTWDAVYAQAALLRANLSEDQYAQVIANIDALRAIASTVITDVSKNLDDVSDKRDDSVDDQLDALDKILELTEDLIKAEADERIEAIEDEIDAYKKIIDLKKESLRATKDENDYAKNVAEKTKEIAALQARIDQLKLDDSREARAERAELESQLADLQGSLGDLQSDHAYQTQTDALDKAADDFEAARQEEIEAIENSISSAEKLYQAALARIESSWDTLYQDLINWNTEAGSSLNSEITDNWMKAIEAVKLYGTYAQAVAGLKAEQEAAENNAGSTGGNSTIVATGTPTVIPPRVETPAITPEAPAPAPEPDPEPEPIKKVKVVSGRWNVRTGPSTSKKILGVVGEGTTLDYRGETSGKWYAVTYKGKNAWINNGGSKLIEELPKYHSGGVAGDKAPIKDKEVLSVLEEGEWILADKMKKAVYTLVDFKEYLEEKLGHAIGTVAAPIPHAMIPALAGASKMTQDGIEVGQMSFSPNIQVEINHTGEMTDSDARHYGKVIATTAVDELYEGFRQRGIGKLLGARAT